MSNFKEMVCSHSVKDKRKTCYSNESLNKLSEYWNKRHPDKKITETTPIKIWEKLKINMNSVCDTEKCWLNQQFIKNNLDKELTQYTFAPQAPEKWKANPNEWLNSLDIENVMKQYERKYPNFVFIGPSPIDFDKHLLYGECVWDELCKFQLRKHISNGKNKVGIIFNLDPHYKDGSHWISTFIDIKNKYIFFFDSTGEKCPKQVKALIKRITEQGKLLNIIFQYYENKKEHQLKDTECGVYSLYLLTQLLSEQKKVEDFTSKRIADKEMEGFRKIFFNL